MAVPAPCMELGNGVRMPAFGLGTWQTAAGEAGAAVGAALAAGYRLLDTAAVYQNEAEVGDALHAFLQAGRARRADLFVITKLWCTHNRESDVESALRESLKKLKLDYVDLYLVHQPACFNHDMSEQDHSVSVTDTWRGMEAVYEKGLARAIGVSNFNEEQIGRILKMARVPVHNSQVELHLHFQQHQHVQFCREHGVSVTCYAPMGSPGRSKYVLPSGHKPEWPATPEPIENELVLALAAKYNKTPAQVLCRHLLQKGLAIIPKSVSPQRIVENAQLFDFQLSEQEMGQLNAQPQAGRMFLQDFMVGHPEDPWKQERHN